MIEEKLKLLKKEYTKIEPTSFLVQDGWRELKSQLEPNNRLFNFAVFRKSIVFAVIAIILTVTISYAAQKSKPGNTLYPVKILSDRVYSTITGDYEASIEKRAQEVIETSNNGPSFDTASKQYQQTIEEAKEKSKDDEAKKVELRKNLEEQEKRFSEAQNDESEKSNNRLNEILEQTRRTRGEVKGENDQRNIEGYNEQEDNSHKEDQGGED